MDHSSLVIAMAGSSVWIIQVVHKPKSLQKWAVLASLHLFVLCVYHFLLTWQSIPENEQRGRAHLGWWFQKWHPRVAWPALEPCKMKQGTSVQNVTHGKWRCVVGGASYEYTRQSYDLSVLLPASFFSSWTCRYELMIDGVSIPFPSIHHPIIHHQCLPTGESHLWPRSLLGHFIPNQNTLTSLFLPGEATEGFLTICCHLTNPSAFPKGPFLGYMSLYSWECKLPFPWKSPLDLTLFSPFRTVSGMLQRETWVCVALLRLETMVKAVPSFLHREFCSFYTGQNVWQVLIHLPPQSQARKTNSYVTFNSDPQTIIPWSFIAHKMFSSALGHLHHTMFPQPLFYK